jgi:spore germination protein GerM
MVQNATVYIKSDTCYYVFVAARKQYRKPSQKKESKSSQAAVIFWLVFAIIIIFVFMINAEIIKKNFDLFMTRLTNSPGAEGEFQDEDGVSGETVFEQPSVSDRIVNVTDNSAGTQPVEPQRTAEQVTQPDTQTQPQPSAQSQSQSTTQSQTQSPAQLQTQSSVQPQAQPQPSTQTRDRVVYFTQVDKDGQILQSKVTRRLPVSEAPMTDVLNIMLSGPLADEINRGILNLIPKNTRLLSAAVRGSTAYLSFSEDFLFNTFGIEGYVAQLRQIVWTVTEFPTVTDVQILVDGRRIDYLGEGIYIGSPINRQSF